MFIIPYILQPAKISQTEFALSTLWVFMSDGGKTIWETDEDTCSEEEILEEYILANGFKGRALGVKDGCYLFEVDDETTKLSEFYSWTDFTKKEEEPSGYTWRPFFWIDDAEPSNSDNWGWEKEADGMSIEKFGTVKRLWDLLPTS